MDTTKKIYIETFGCQMNFSDSEIIASILEEENYEGTKDKKEADLILINTCSIRENAEQKVWSRLRDYRALKKSKPGLIIGILGCMAERLKEDLRKKENIVDIIAGPDAYRKLPILIEAAEGGRESTDVILSTTETYDDINPIRYDSNGVSAFISIMRGCENYCSYCVVPYTRGKERSRNPKTIIDEAARLASENYKEITLLGQNVNSYHYESDGISYDFPRLIKEIALVDPSLRIRFATSHPKDMSEALLKEIASHKNICNSIHLPIQSGSNNVLKQMQRKYTREDYLERIKSIRKIIPGCAISTDIICGFCGETEEDHKETLSLMEEVGFDFAFMFKYSERSGTHAAATLDDNIPEEIKTSRLQEVIELQQRLSYNSNQEDVGKTHSVLIEGSSKRSDKHLFGRTSQNKVIVFPRKDKNIGEYTMVKVNDCTSATLIGEIIN